MSKPSNGDPFVALAGLMLLVFVCLVGLGVIAAAVLLLQVVFGMR